MKNCKKIFPTYSIGFTLNTGVGVTNSSSIVSFYQSAILDYPILQKCKYEF